MVSPLKIIFAGTPEFATIILAALAQTQHVIVAVYTQPDRPAGRGLKLTPSSVKSWALQHQLPVFSPLSLKEPAVQAELAAWQADVMIVAAYGLIIPQAILDLPRLGCINVHPSLLPRWRGAAPIQRSLYAGDSLTGVTIMQMEAGLDTGPMLLKREYLIGPEENAQTLHNALAHLGGEALIETLQGIAKNKITPIAQDAQKATYAHKITKQEAHLNWQRPAKELVCWVRAFNPWPVAYAYWHKQPLRIWKACALAQHHEAVPGTLLAASHLGIDIATSEGVFRLLSMQQSGGKIMPVADFYNAHHAKLIPGEIWE